MERATKANEARQSWPWNGVNLGGWLLLEPGTAPDLFGPYRQGHGKVNCEWELMKRLREDNAVEKLWEHRHTWITREDFQLIRDRGLNAVRLPLGYWTIVGPAPGEPYEGPALNCIDQAVAWAEEVGLQIILDLHGCPGGESAEPPCGHEDGSWNWRHWRFDESLKALKALCLRYRGRKAVTGVEVCNEPSNKVPLDVLCSYYASAVDIVRSSGMSANEVAIIVPVYQRSAAEFAEAWNKKCQDPNVCFDFHYYHCFGIWWHGKSLAETLRGVQSQLEELRRFPAIVGEWSLALGDGARTAQGLGSADKVREIFGRLQMTAYGAASHGHFFWNYKDDAGADWDWMQNTWLPGSKPYTLPAWNGEGEDPLEEICDPSPAQPLICMGDDVLLRAFQGRYLEVNGSTAVARGCTISKDCRFTIMPAGKDRAAMGSPVVAGTAVRICTFSGRVLCVVDDSVVALEPHEVSPDASDFILRSDGQLKHRGALYLQHRSSQRYVEVEASDLRPLSGNPDGTLLLGKEQVDYQYRLTVLKPWDPASQRALPRLAAAAPPSLTIQAKKERGLANSPSRCTASLPNLSLLWPTSGGGERSFEGPRQIPERRASSSDSASGISLGASPAASVRALSGGRGRGAGPESGVRAQLLSRQGCRRRAMYSEKKHVSFDTAISAGI
mmetsp:Transcript_58385/g.126298  ORF Transcript_58385/g.126298 Transcript_58385/m.126298 type:complete len:670 (+) Transcript_58385:49-2058(+)|eukprot:CAMPEP_0170591440 /NCGR_PEP_ID=MMETSP0224-20130122/12407_1 /TAXON_ID=285029 /ORGANISM="Togula jolla, Strain CCCM 725" /LENGTH=669 /DNA_ID=CAMNT_0010915309 /DNA_START=49 /DNA_END=2058 /DNA_ORIENTATION=-